jgi:hypothetical protein
VTAGSQILFSLRLVDRLLERALDLLDLGLAFRDIELCYDQVRFDFRDLAFGRLCGGLLLRAVELEDRRSLLDVAAKVNIDLGNAPVGLLEHWHGLEEQ